MSGKPKHGMSGTRIYDIWRDMRHRCNIPGMKNYKNYGGRGIRVCDEWNDSFEIFFKWAIENGYSDDLTIDRINVNGNYEPSNCRWTNKHVQCTNRRPYNKSTEYIGVYLHAEKSCYYTQIRKDGKLIFSYSNVSKNECAKARNKYILDNNLYEYPLNAIQKKYEDIRVHRDEGVRYVAENKTSHEVISKRHLKDLGKELKLTPQFIYQCIIGKRNSKTYDFRKEVVV